MPAQAIFVLLVRLAPPEDFDAADLLEDGEGTREERVFRMWMNSVLGPDGHYINDLYADLRTAEHILRVCEKIKPGSVFLPQPRRPRCSSNDHLYLHVHHSRAVASTGKKSTRTRS